MTDFVPSEKGVTIRQPSTANLMVDSKDRAAFELANNFQITRSNSLLNGFFTRIGLTELVLEWNQPNVSQLAPKLNSDLIIDASGSVSGTTTTTFNPPTGFYTAKAAIDYLLASLNTISASVTPATTWTLTNPTPASVVLTPNNAIGIQLDGAFATSLGVATGAIVPFGPATPLFIGIAVDLRPYRYLDFVSAQLTYNQDLKDTSTASYTRDVLARWYMDYDQPNSVDAYGLPVLMGYEPIYLRRIFSPPKQIKWSANQPVGNIAFQVYDNNGRLAACGANCDFLMTLQVSEV